MSGEFRYAFRVAFHEVDAAGAMFFAHLFRHAHDAYEAWLAARGLALAELAGGRPCRLPLAHAEADYLRPLGPADDVIGTLEVAAVGESSFTLVYEFRRAGGELCARARTVHVAVDPGSGRPIALPPALRAALGGTVGDARPAPG